MKNIQKPWIKLKETIDIEDYNLINMLQKECIHEDQTTLKLELDYKLKITSENSKISSIENINEFMYFDGDQLIGYIGINSFGSPNSQIEVNGMVKPEYRRQGVFKTLFELVVAEWKRRKSSSMLLLSDRKSSSGQEFIKGVVVQYDFSEFEMYLEEDNWDQLKKQVSAITLKKATNEDTYEINRLDAICFADEDDISIESETGITEENMIIPEKEEKRGMTIYLAVVDQQIIGKVHIYFDSNMGSFYGVCVLPEHRGKGYGRAMLIAAIGKLKEMNAKEIMIQVETDNSNAFMLYKSCGFMERSIMDYYEFKR